MILSSCFFLPAGISKNTGYHSGIMAFNFYLFYYMRVMKNYWIGTSGWNYKHWKGNIIYI